MEYYFLYGSIALCVGAALYRFWPRGSSGRLVMPQAPAFVQQAAPTTLAEAEAQFLGAYDNLKRAGKEMGVRQLLEEMRTREATVVRSELAGTFAPPVPPKDQPAPPA